MNSFVNEIAKTIYNEARGEGKIGMEAVASTINNRYNMDRSYMGGQDYNSICNKGYEGARGSNPNPTNKYDQESYNYSKQLAEQVVNKSLKDTTGGATHFDASRDSFKKFEDKGGMKYTEQIGKHYFFKEK